MDGWQRSEMIAAGAVLIAALSLLVSLAGYRLARATRRDGKRQSLPNVVPTLTPFKSEPGWFHLHILLTSRNSVGYRADRLTIKSPSGARLLTEDGAMVENKPMGKKYARPLPLEKATRSVQARVHVAPAGTIPTGSLTYMWGSAESHGEPFVLFVPRSGAVRMVLDVASKEAVSRRIAIKLKIDVTRESADTPSAK